MADKNTGKAIKIAMINADISVIEMAERLGKKPAQVSRWRNRGCDSVTIMQEIAKECGISLAELMSNS